MTNRFLEFYSEELSALRHRAVRFSAAFPKIAGRLRLAKDTSDDPHVERLIQSFAFTAARIRQKIDDSIPELTDTLLETLYPHYLSPAPSMTVIQFHAEKALEAAQTIPRLSEVSSDQIEGDVCRFRTTQPVTLAPVKIADVKLMARPIEAPNRPDIKASGCLAITVQKTGKTPLSELDLTSLRFYIAAPSRDAVALQSLLMNHCTDVAVADHAEDVDARFLHANALSQVGFSEDEALLPYPSNSFKGYRALTEFFTLTQKFLFFDVAFGTFTQSDQATLYIYLDAAPGRLERDIKTASLQLNCTPIVNHFPKRAEPISLDGTRTTYPLLAEARRIQTQRVHSVTAVTLTDSDGNARQIHPFFHRLSGNDIGPTSWQLKRHTVGDGSYRGRTSLSFIDEVNRPKAITDSVASVEILATNGNLPSRLPFGGGQPRLKMSDPVDSLAGITCLQPMTSEHMPDDDDHRAWRLLSHLSLNHLSITGGGAPALRNILSLYDTTGSKETTRLIASISDVSSTPGIARLGSTMVSGSDVTIFFDEDIIDASDAFFFGTILDRFLGCYTTINTFTRLTLRMKNRTDILAQFPPRAGEEQMI